MRSRLVLLNRKSFVLTLIIAVAPGLGVSGKLDYSTSLDCECRSVLARPPERQDQKRLYYSIMRS